MASLAKLPTNQRQGSRPNSASSSSVITVQRASSVTARNSSHPSVTGLRSQSPNEVNPIPTNLTGRTLSPETSKRRSSALYTRPDSGSGFREGVGNLNRWSQSTGSSKNSVHNRRSSFSKRLSGSFGSFGGFTGGQSQTPSPNVPFSTRGRPSSQKGPAAQAKVSSPSKPAPVLPPIVTLSSLSQAVDAADSPSTIATVTPATADILSPSKRTSTQRDYFGDGWSSRSPTKPMAGMKRPAPSYSARPIKLSPISIDNSTSPGSPGPPESAYSPRTTSRLKHASRRISQNGHHRYRDDPNKGSATTEGESSASDNRARADRAQKRKAPSQKAMLSKALQKAHHAVTLDQHSNFEGAMHAYQDACALLQKVMIRSSGIEDRQKLDAVVSHGLSGLKPESHTDSIVSAIRMKHVSPSYGALSQRTLLETARLCHSVLRKETRTVPKPCQLPPTTMMESQLWEQVRRHLSTMKIHAEKSCRISATYLPYLRGDNRYMEPPIG